jgi:deoxycytidine triphosphate deaminase
VDLGGSLVDAIDARRYWKRIELSPTQAITLRPNEMILARTYEKFTIPKEFAGKIEGRSSFARMGLMIHCSADFINPGYRGHMPLQLVNTGQTPIRIRPFLPICQLVVVRLLTTPKVAYGDPSIGSKYMDDDGGPSYWWKDKSYVQLHDWLKNQSVSEEIRQKIGAAIGHRENDLIDRFESWFAAQRLDQITNVQDLLGSFAVSEGRKKRLAQIRFWFDRWCGPALATTSISRALADHHARGDYILWAVSALAVLWSAWSWYAKDAPGEYLTADELSRLSDD